MAVLAGMSDEPWSDGLPYVPVSEDRLRSALGGRDPDAIVCAMVPPSFAVVTARDLAEATIMSGCRDDHLGMVETALRAVVAPQFNLLGIQTTTEPATPLLVVNGPWRHTAPINCRANLFGNAAAANAPIGRALRLLLTRLGNAVPGVTDMATFGHPGKLTYCIGEDEESSPWDALHVARGFRKDDNVITAFGADGPINVNCPVKEPAAILSMIELALAAPTTNNMLLGGQVAVVLSPEHARSLAVAGMSREDVQEALFRRAVVGADAIPTAVRDVFAQFRREEAPLDVFRAADSPADVLLVVAGGAGSHSAVIPTFGPTRATSESATASRDMEQAP